MTFAGGFQPGKETLFHQHMADRFTQARMSYFDLVVAGSRGVTESSQQLGNWIGL
jgi:hypothetical protein